jgi:hypothetical protein
MGDLGGGDSREPTAHEEAPAPAGGCGADHLVVMVHGIVGRYGYTVSVSSYPYPLCLSFGLVIEPRNRSVKILLPYTFLSWGVSGILVTSQND